MDEAGVETAYSGARQRRRYVNQFTFYDGLGRKLQQTDEAGVETAYSNHAGFARFPPHPQDSVSPLNFHPACGHPLPFPRAGDKTRSHGEGGESSADLGECDDFSGTDDRKRNSAALARGAATVCNEAHRTPGQGAPGPQGRARSPGWGKRTPLLPDPLLHSKWKGGRRRGGRAFSPDAAFRPCGSCSSWAARQRRPTGGDERGAGASGPSARRPYHQHFAYARRPVSLICVCLSRQ
jgi:hypothetical protein